MKGTITTHADKDLILVLPSIVFGVKEEENTLLIGWLIWSIEINFIKQF